MNKEEENEYNLRCRNDFVYFCEQVLKLEMTDYHAEIATLPLTNRYLCMVVPRGHSKCISEGSRVLLSDGSYTPIEEIPCHDSNSTKEEVISLSKNNFRNTSHHAKRLYQGYKLVSKVISTSGRELECTSTHKFLTPKGWLPLSELSEGEFIATPRELPIFGKERLSEAEIKFIAYMLGDGCSSNGMSFSNSNEEIVSDFKAACDSLEFKAIKYGIDYHLSNKGRPLHSCGPRVLLEKHGLKGKTARYKFIPSRIFKLPKEQLALFINRLYACDGAIGAGKSKCIIYGSVSLELIKELKNLLLRFGFLARIYQSHTVYKNRPYLSYNLCIWGEQECLRFVREIGIFTKDYKIKSFGKKHNPNCDVIPSNLIYAGLGGKTKELKRIGYKDISTHSKYNPSREKALLISQIFNKENGIKLATSDIFWDKIKSITSIGKKHVYDLVVEEDHNFVAENFYVHNTMLFSIAYPLWRLFREKDIEICLVSSSVDQSMKIFSKAQYILETNPFFRQILPTNRFETWNKSQITTRNHNTYFIKPFNSTARGTQPHYIIYDDVLREDDVSPEQVKEIFWSIFFPAGQVHKCQHLVVGTPQSIEDLYANLEQAKNWTVYKRSAVIEDDKGNWIRPLWPERFSLENLREMLDSMGSYRFEREMMCRPKSTGESLYPQEMLLNTLDYDLEFSDKTNNATFIGCDFAMSTEKTGDYNAFIVIEDAVGKTHKKKTDKGIIEIQNPVFVKKILHFKGVGQTEAITRLKSIYPTARIVGDESGVGAKFIKELRDLQFVVEAQDFQPAKRNMILLNLRTLLEKNRLVIPNGDECKPLTDLLIREMSGFRLVKNPNTGHESWKSNLSHDDCVMGLAMAVKNASSQRKTMKDLIFGA